VISGVTGVTVVTVTGMACFFCPARLRAHWAPGIPCALFILGRDIFGKPRAKTRGEIAKSRSVVITRESG
jgi:hypothetical protein